MAEYQPDPVTGSILGAAIAVHRELGPGLLESAYQDCLVHELVDAGLRVSRQVPIPLIYKGVRMDCGFRADLVVNLDVIVEVKSVEALLPIHTAQVLTYLRLMNARRVLLLNFNEMTLMAGFKCRLGKGNSVPVEKAAGQ